MRKPGESIVRIAAVAWLTAAVAWLSAAAAVMPATADTGRVGRKVYFPILRRSPRPAPRTAQPFEQQVVDLVNKERKGRGLAALRIDERLIRSARAHSQDMSRNNFCGHTGSDGSSPWDRIDRQGYPLAGGGETVACGQQTPAEVVGAWKNSQDHWDVLMGNYKDIGVGYVYVPGVRFGHFWTADLGVQQSPVPGDEAPVVEVPPPVVNPE